MEILLSITILFISGMVGMFLDFKCGVKEPVIYWMLGSTGSFLSSIIGHIS